MGGGEGTWHVSLALVPHSTHLIHMPQRHSRNAPVFFSNPFGNWILPTMNSPLPPEATATLTYSQFQNSPPLRESWRNNINATPSVLRKLIDWHQLALTC